MRREDALCSLKEIMADFEKVKYKRVKDELTVPNPTPAASLRSSSTARKNG